MQYKPHDYQKFAVDFIETHPQAAVLLECGLGKTSITLTALNDMMFDRFEVHKVLIIAPIRVCKNSWAAEIAKWDHLNGMTYSLILGTKDQRLAALRQKADLYIINRENVQWLIESSGMPFDFDMVVIDELSSFKNHQSNGSKCGCPVRKADAACQRFGLYRRRQRGADTFAQAGRTGRSDRSAERQTGADCVLVQA